MLIANWKVCNSCKTSYNVLRHSNGGLRLFIKGEGGSVDIWGLRVGGRAKERVSRF